MVQHGAASESARTHVATCCSTAQQGATRGRATSVLRRRVKLDGWGSVLRGIDGLVHVCVRACAACEAVIEIVIERAGARRSRLARAARPPAPQCDLLQHSTSATCCNTARRVATKWVLAWHGVPECRAPVVQNALVLCCKCAIVCSKRAAPRCNVSSSTANGCTMLRHTARRCRTLRAHCGAIEQPARGFAYS